MKKIYVVYQNNSYPITDCEFFKDIIVYRSFQEFEEEVFIPINEYTIEEEDVIINSLTYNEFQQTEKEKNDKRSDITDEAWAKFPNPIHPYNDMLNDRIFKWFCFDIEDCILGQTTNYPTKKLKDYPFFNFEIYKQYFNEVLNMESKKK